MSASLAPGWGEGRVGAAGEARNKVLRSVVVEEKMEEEKEEEKEEKVAAVGLLKVPVGNKKVKSIERNMKGRETKGLWSQKHEGGKGSRGFSSSRKEEMLGWAGSG